MNKGGLSNIEMVLAFIIFLGAVLFGLYYFNTQYDSSGNEKGIDFITNQIVKNVSTEVRIVSVLLKRDSIPSNQKIIGINLSETIEEGSNFAIYNSSEYEVAIDLEGNILYLNIENIGDFITIRESANIDQNYQQFSEHPDVEKSYYEIGSLRNEKLISEQILLNLNDTYYYSYNFFKETTGIGSDFEIALEVDFGNGEKINFEKESPSNVNVYSKNQRVEILKKTGKVEFADMKIRAW